MGFPPLERANLRLASPASGCHLPRVIKVYIYQKCSTCRDAVKWLEAHGIPHRTVPIRETPPSPAELESALAILGGDVRKLFNTSGIDYRELGMKDLLPTLTPAGAIDRLSKNGNLVKRPFVIGDGVALTGFRPEVWEKTLKKG